MTLMEKDIAARPYDVEAIRRDFPALSLEVHGKPLVYLDNAASAQKPKAMLDALMKSYTRRICERPPRPSLSRQRRDGGL